MAEPRRLLVFNAGSSSLKFDLLEVSPGGERRQIVAGSFVETADGSAQYELRTAQPPEGSPPKVATLAAAAEYLLGWLPTLGPLSATAHRIVHGGERFRAATRLGDAELAALEALSELAPLHNPPAVAVIRAARHALPGVPAIGVFDTAYYAELPPAAWRYAVPALWRSEYGIRRYGFHGMAHQSLCEGARALLGTHPGRRIVSLQLGRGCSVTASDGQRAIATSMGFTPLEGLVMGTRSGDLDPGAVLYVMERSGLSATAMREALNTQSGLLGLSGKSADMRQLLALEAAGDADAALAIELFCRRARQYLSAYITELGGVDAIAFGGGIGENCPGIRARIVGPLAWAGIALDEAANSACLGVAARLEAPASAAAVICMPVDEAGVIAGEAATLLGG